MRQKEAAGDPDMLELKQFLMTEVVTTKIDQRLRTVFRPDRSPPA